MILRLYKLTKPGHAARRAAWQFAALAAMCGGCWQEIPSEPAADARKIAAENHSGATADAPDASVASEPVVLATPDAPPADAPIVLEDSPPETPTAVVLDGEDEIEDAVDAPDSSNAATTDEPPSPPSDAAAAFTAAERLQGWTAASKWSLAAAMYAKGLDPVRYEPVLAEARSSAAAIGVELPQLPTAAGEDNLENTVIHSLRDDAGPALAELMTARLDAAAGAAARLAMQSRLWLLTYSPQDGSAAAEARAARQAGADSGLPEEAWLPLVELVEQRADFPSVRQAVFDMDRRVAAHLDAAAK